MSFGINWGTLAKKELQGSRCFFRTFCFSLNLTGTLNLTKCVHYHWSRMGK